jgi:hypothetical protein
MEFFFKIILLIVLVVLEVEVNLRPTISLSGDQIFFLTVLAFLMWGHLL